MIGSPGFYVCLSAMNKDSVMPAPSFSFPTVLSPWSSPDVSYGGIKGNTPVYTYSFLL